MGKEVRESSIGTLLGKSSKLRMFVCKPRKRTILGSGVLSNRALCLCPLWLSFPELNSGTRHAPREHLESTGGRAVAESHCTAVRCSFPILGPSTRPERLEFPLRFGQDARPSPPAIPSTPSAHAFRPRLPATSFDDAFRPRLPATSFDDFFRRAVHSDRRSFGVSGSSSSAAIQLLPPSGVTAALADRCRPPQCGRAYKILAGSSPCRPDMTQAADLFPSEI